MTDSTEPDQWRPTACILCECNCGILVQTSPAEEGRHLKKIRGDKNHPPRPVTPATRRCGWSTTRTPRPAYLPAETPRRRKLRRNRLGHRDHRNRRRIRPDRADLRRRQDLLLRRRRPGQSPRRRVQQRLPQVAGIALPVQRAGPGEDRRVLGRLPALRRPHPRGVRARRGVGVRRQEPVDVAELPARPDGAQRDR